MNTTIPVVDPEMTVFIRSMNNNNILLFFIFTEYWGMRPPRGGGM